MAEGRQKVLLLCLEDYTWAGDIYREFLSTLNSKAEVICAYSKFLVTLRAKDEVIRDTDLQTAIETLKDGSVSVAIIFEPSVIEKKDELLTDTLIQFTKAGGTTIFAGMCSSIARPPNINEFFGKWNLPWKSGIYLRTTFTANPRARLDLKARIATSYSMKALHLGNVATEDLLYITTDDSHTESLVFGPERVKLTGEGPIVFAQYHQGRIGWVGDVNNEQNTGPVMLAMSGL